MTAEHKTHLIGMTLDELSVFCSRFGEKTYRARQIFEWLYRHKAGSIPEMTNLSRELQARIAEEAEIYRLDLAQELHSRQDGSRKFLFTLPDGNQIETMYLPDGERRTVCVSSQAGCALNCRFCATGAMGLIRNLSAGEIVEQVLSAERLSGETITNVVFMGMGEPLHNYDNVLKAADILSDDRGFKLGVRHITISTVGLADKIRRYLEEGHGYKLAVSLNAGSDNIRKTIMPITNRFSLKDIAQAILSTPRPNSREITFEYVLLKGVNDTEREISLMTAFVKTLPVKVNLIPFNPVDGTFEPTPERKILDICSRLRGEGIQVNIRKSLGRDIQGACGQLFVSARRETRASQQA